MNLSTIDPMVASCLLGVIVGALLGMIIVFVTINIIRRTGQPKKVAAAVEKPTAVIPTEKPKQEQVKPKPVIRPVSAPAISRIDTGIHRTAPVASADVLGGTERQVVPENKEATTAPDLPYPLGQSTWVRQSPKKFRYYVSGIDAPFDTLKEAIDAFPDEKGRYDGKRSPQWMGVSQYVRDNIRREPIV